MTLTTAFGRHYKQIATTATSGTRGKQLCSQNRNEIGHLLSTNQSIHLFQFVVLGHRSRGSPLCQANI